MGKFEKTSWNAWIWSRVPCRAPRNQFLTFLVNNCKKSTVNYSIEKSILLKFVNLSLTFCRRLSEETHFPFQLSSNPLILHFLKVLVFEEAHSLSKMIFEATLLQKIPECDIFQKTLFCTLAPIFDVLCKKIGRN